MNNDVLHIVRADAPVAEHRTSKHAVDQQVVKNLVVSKPPF